MQIEHAFLMMARKMMQMVRDVVGHADALAAPFTRH